MQETEKIEVKQEEPARLVIAVSFENLSYPTLCCWFENMVYNIVFPNRASVYFTKWAGEAGVNVIPRLKKYEEGKIVLPGNEEVQQLVAVEEKARLMLGYLNAFIQYHELYSNKKLQIAVYYQANESAWKIVRTQLRAEYRHAFLSKLYHKYSSQIVQWKEVTVDDIIALSGIPDKYTKGLRRYKLFHAYQSYNGCPSQIKNAACWRPKEKKENLKKYEEQLYNVILGCWVMEVAQDDLGWRREYESVKRPFQKKAVNRFASEGFALNYEES